MSAEDQDQLVIDQLRLTLAAGFSFVRGMEMTAAAGAVSLENVIADHVTALTVDQSDIRPCRLNAVLALQVDVAQAVERIRTLPETLFSLAGDEDGVNTAVEDEEAGS